MKREKVPNYTFWYFLLGLFLGLFLAFIGTLLVLYTLRVALHSDDFCSGCPGCSGSMVCFICWPFSLAVVLAMVGSRQRKLVQSRQEERIAARRASEYQKQLGELTRKDQEHQEVETAMSRGKKEWEATFDSVEYLLLLTDENGVITRCNRPLPRHFAAIFSS